MTLLNVLDARAVASFIAAHGTALSAEPNRFTPNRAEEGLAFSGLANRETAARLRQWVEMRRT